MWWTKKKERNSSYDYSNRDKHHRFYSSQNWQNLRLYKLSCNPLCELCLPLLVPASVVDHKESLTDAYAKRLDFDNLQSLCPPCHNRKSRLEQLEYLKRVRDARIDDRMDDLNEF